MEVPAVANGVITAITKNAGDTVKSAETVGQLQAGAAPVAAKAAETAAPFCEKTLATVACITWHPAGI